MKLHENVHPSEDGSETWDNLSFRGDYPHLKLDQR